MKIAILTFLHAFNYGAELQAFALQRKLRNIGYDVTLLDVCRPGKNPEYIMTDYFKPIFAFTDNQTKTSGRNRLLSKYLTAFFKLIFPKRDKVRHDRFYSFHKQYTNLSTKKYLNFDALYSESFDFTHFIVGSDQVWNFTNGFSPEPYFLTFAKGAKRISYAASLGHSSIPDEIVPLYKEWINNFDSISLREKEGVEVISTLTQKKVEHVLDPTLLLNKGEWLSSLGISQKTNKEKYVLVYLLSKSDFSVKLAQKIAKQIGGIVKIIVPNVWSPYMLTAGVEPLYNAGPKEFIELFAGASFAVTNSFHGTCFSVNFNIPFYSTPHSTKKTNSRFVSLLSSVGLSDRILYDGTNSEITMNVDFSQPNTRLEQLRNKSLEYIINALK